MITGNAQHIRHALLGYKAVINRLLRSVFFVGEGIIAVPVCAIERIVLGSILLSADGGTLFRMCNPTLGMEKACIPSICNQ